MSGMVHKLAVEVSKLEAGRKQVNIAQIKEVINCIFDYLHVNDLDSEILNRLKDDAGKRKAKKNNDLLKKKISKIGSKDKK